jgi:hypothetical protein
MDEFNDLQFLLDDDIELLQTTNLYDENSPLFGRTTERFPLNSDVLYPRQSNEGSINAPKTTPNETLQNCKVDVSRFPEVHINNIEKLRSLAVNTNMHVSVDQRQTLDECV